MKLPLLMLIGLAATTAAPERRDFDLLGALGSATQGTKIGTALEIISAFSKVETFIQDVKNLAPEVHQALNSSISDITNSMTSIIDHIGQAIDPTAHHKRSGFDLLGALGSATQGTNIGTALEIINAFSKVETFIQDVKNLAPEVHQALNSSISVITGSISSIIDHIGQAINPTAHHKRSGFDLLGALGSATQGTKIGTALEIINAFSKVETFIQDVKNLAPEVHQALNSSISDITGSISSIIDHIGQAIDPNAHRKRSGFDLLGALGSATQGTNIGTALEIINAFSKVETFIQDVKNLAPEVHQALNSSISDITGSISSIIDHIGQAINPTAHHKRSGFDLLGALGSATQGTNIGTALEIINAFSKVETFIQDVKNLAPEVHQALNSSISDITGSISSIIDHIGQAINPTSNHKRGFDLLGALGSATQGTNIGTALEIINAFSKVETFIQDVKNLAPEVHQALNSSISDITDSISSIIDHIGQAINPTAHHKRSGFDLLGALRSATQGTKIGTALEIINAFSKVETFIQDVKNLAPEVHQALNASISDITNSMTSIIDHIGQAIDPKAP